MYFSQASYEIASVTWDYLGLVVVVGLTAVALLKGMRDQFESPGPEILLLDLGDLDFEEEYEEDFDDRFSVEYISVD